MVEGASRAGGVGVERQVGLLAAREARGPGDVHEDLDRGGESGATAEHGENSFQGTG